jgi:hypothetical protein
MAKITNKSQLNVGTELTIDEVARTFTLNVAGNLVAKDGVSLQALYSKFVDLWTTSGYQDSPFPMYAIDVLSGQFQFGTDGDRFSGWKPANDTVRNMLRDGGWSEYSAAGVLNRQYAGFNGLGSINAGAQPYYHLATVDAPTNFPFDDQFNVGIQVFGDAANGNFDKRTFAKTFVREYGKKYKDSVLADTGKTATGAFKVDFLISNEDDLKIQANDAAMSGAPYSGITVEFFGSDQNKTIGSGSYPFRIIIEGNNATLEQIYTKIQYLLRQNSDIDAGAGSVTGKTAAAMLEFVGDTLNTKTGVFINNVQSNDINRLVLKDQNGVDRTYPYVAAGTLSFNASLIGAGSSYRLMFTAPPGAGNDYGEAGAITVNDGSGTPITGTISAALIGFTFDYDGNVQGGFTAGTDRPVTLIGIRPGFGKFAVATGTLSRSKGISLSLVAEQDRAYAA